MNETMLRVFVSGTSMYPSLLPADSVIVARRETYPLGSLLVFSYKSEGYLVHRLLRVSNGRYYCKGDNSLRLENVGEEQLVGRVIFIKRRERTFAPPEVDNKFIEMSLKISKEFRLTGYNHKKIMESDIYIEFKKLYLEGIFL